MRHKDPRTTQRYGQHLRALTDDPALVVAIAVARRVQDEEEIDARPLSKPTV